MHKAPINASDAPSAVGGYAQALDLQGFRRLVFVSGQVPVGLDDRLATDFATQCRTAWTNVVAQLHAAGLSIENLVKVTIFLADRQFAMENRSIRQEVLGDTQVALTVIITGIFDEKWLIEIEAIAAE